jgi:hypothetical protein
MGVGGFACAREENQTMRRTCVSLGVVVSGVVASGAVAATYATQDSVAAFEAAVGGAVNVVGQDFQGFATDDDMTGPGTFLSGVEASTNMPILDIFGANNRLFGSSSGTTIREDGVAYYQFDYTLPYLGVAFEIAAWDPASSAATVEVSFGDGTSDSFQIEQLGDSEADDPVFLGITSATAITRVIIREPLEDATGGNEEIAFSWVGVSRVPGAGVVPAMAIAVVGAGVRRRRVAR